MPTPRPRRWLRWAIAGVVVLLLAAGGAAAALILHSPHNVSHPDVEFTAPTTTQAQDTTPQKPAKKKHVADNFQWPRYGYDLGRARVFAEGSRLNPPFRRGWKFIDGALLEFPPVIYGKSLYMIDDNGWVKAVNKQNGKLRWQHKVGTLAAASPTIDVPDKLIFVPVLSFRGSSPGNGRFYALSMKTGRIVWTHIVPAGTESSPMVYGHSVYFGDNGGTVLSLQTRTGHVNWSYHASGAVKGGPAYENGKIYFGDYAGRVYALNAFNGHQVWNVGTSGTHFGFGSGNFYSTAAIAFGRVYLGNTDGRVYSFAERDGTLAWATSTGAYVYSSPAVAEVPKLGPTVYIGSYDGNFYAFNAQSGAVRWEHAAGGRISGSPTIVGNVVYYSNLGSKSTAGLDLRTGHQVFSFSDGAFNPVIADPKAVYMVGYGAVYEMFPRSAEPHHEAKSKPPRRRHQR